MLEKLKLLNSQVVDSNNKLSNLFYERIHLGYEIAFKKLKEKGIVPNKPFALKEFKETEKEEHYILVPIEKQISYFIENGRLLKHEPLFSVVIWGYEVNQYGCQNKFETLLGTISLD